MFEVLPPALQFARMSDDDKAKELRRTRQLVGELLLLPRTEFPAVSVIYRGTELTDWELSDSFTVSRPALREARGKATPEQAIQIFASHIPAMIAKEQLRIQRQEPPRYWQEGMGANRHDARHAGMPRGGVLAPLVLP